MKGSKTKNGFYMIFLKLGFGTFWIIYSIGFFFIVTIQNIK